MTFTYEEQKKAVKLYVKYGKKAATVMHELGYPKSYMTLIRWYKAFAENGRFKETRCGRRPYYTAKQKRKAVGFYMSHGKSISFTVRTLGYPSRELLAKWIAESNPEADRVYEFPACEPAGEACSEEVHSVVESDSELENPAGVVPCTSAAEACSRKERSITEAGMEAEMADCKDDEDLRAQNERLRAEYEQLRKENELLRQKADHLQLMNDILTEAGKVIKKEGGISLETLTNREKTVVIDTLRDRHLLKILLEALSISKSSYCYQKEVMSVDKYSKDRQQVEEIFRASKDTFGARRIYLELCGKGKILSERVIRRLMKENDLHAKGRKAKKYSSYMGETSPAVPNLVKRDFHAEKPNLLWLTDITEFHIPAGKVYLSPVIDCYDGWVVSWKIGLSPNSRLANTMLEDAIRTLGPDEKPIVHSDRGFHYRTPSWISIMNDAGLTRSMSKKGCSPDNSACEGFFGRLKNEFFYDRDWKGVNLDEFMKRLDEYMHWYNDKRIKTQYRGSIRQHRIDCGYLAA